MTGRTGLSAGAGEAVRRIEAALDPGAPPDYRALAARLVVAWAEARPQRVGLGGGQGAGKSTLSRLIEAACAEAGLRAIAIGIDDFYLTRAERRTLARSVHPLFETRGPPGTHDMARCGAAIEALRAPGRVELPRFDKGLDDRVGSTTIAGPFDLVLLEGWCVGAPCDPASPTSPPINGLEREHDPDGRWRAEVEARLAADYLPVFERLDELVHLQVPDLDAVRRWRLEQESSRPEAHRLGASQIDRFVQHYERLTRRMLSTLPGRADWNVVLADDHSVARIDRRDRASR